MEQTIFNPLLAHWHHFKILFVISILYLLSPPVFLKEWWEPSYNNEGDHFVGHTLNATYSAQWLVDSHKQPGLLVVAAHSCSSNCAVPVTYITICVILFRDEVQCMWQPKGRYYFNSHRHWGKEDWESDANGEDTSEKKVLITVTSCILQFPIEYCFFGMLLDQPIMD